MYECRILLFLCCAHHGIQQSTAVVACAEEGSGLTASDRMSLSEASAANQSPLRIVSRASGDASPTPFARSSHTTPAKRRRSGAASTSSDVRSLPKSWSHSSLSQAGDKPAHLGRRILSWRFGRGSGVDSHVAWTAAESRLVMTLQRYTRGWLARTGIVLLHELHLLKVRHMHPRNTECLCPLAHATRHRCCATPYKPIRPPGAFDRPIGPSICKLEERCGREARKRRW